MKSFRSRVTPLIWILRVAKGKLLSILLLLITQVGMAGLSLGSVWVLRLLLDEAVAGNRDSFVYYSVLFGGFFLIRIGLYFANRYLLEYTQSSLENCYKKRLFSTLLKKNYASVTSVHSGEWLNRLTSDAVVVAGSITTILSDLGSMIVRLIGSVVMLLLLIPEFVWALIPCTIVFIGISYAFRKVLKKMHVRIQEADGALRILLSERLSSLMIVHSFAQEDAAVKDADEAMEKHKHARMARVRFSNVCNTGFNFVLRGAYVFGAVYCGAGILNGSITSLGTFTAVIQLISQIQAPIANLSGIVPRYYSMTASAERLMAAENFEDDDVKNAHSTPEILSYYENHFRAFRLEDLDFSYPPLAHTESVDMPSVLRNLDLTIPKGEYLAFTGPSGSGKSTVLKLLMCLYRPDRGSRLLVSDDGEEELTANWRGMFAYVPQDNQLLRGTIREVVAFADPERKNNDDEIWEALQISCADVFVRELKNGLDTELGERGSGLSEGQMQRLAIARAIFSKHPVLLFDEATNSLDSAIEMQVLKNLRQLTDRTLLIVTHGKAALGFCDRILRFREGKLISVDEKQNEKDAVLS